MRNRTHRAGPRPAAGALVAGPPGPLAGTRGRLHDTAPASRHHAPGSGHAVRRNRSHREALGSRREVTTAGHRAAAAPVRRAAGRTRSGLARLAHPRRPAVGTAAAGPRFHTRAPEGLRVRSPGARHPAPGPGTGAAGARGRTVRKCKLLPWERSAGVTTPAGPIRPRSGEPVNPG